MGLEVFQEGFKHPSESVEEGGKRGIILEAVLKSARLLLQRRQSPCKQINTLENLGSVMELCWTLSNFA